MFNLENLFFLSSKLNVIVSGKFLVHMFNRSRTIWKLNCYYACFRLCEGGELLDRILSRCMFHCVSNMKIFAQFFKVLVARSCSVLLCILSFAQRREILRGRCKGCHCTDNKCCCILSSPGCCAPRS